MANYANAKSTIAANIYTNHTGQVTAEMVKTAADAIVDTLIAGGYLYAGVAKLTPTQTNPGSPDANVFYIATEPGTYTNFVGAGGPLVVADGEVAIFKFNGTWSKEVTGAATAAQVNQLGQESSGLFIDRGSIYNEKYGTTNRTCVFYPIPDKNAIYHIRISEINNQTESPIYLGILSSESPYSASQLLDFSNIQLLGDDVTLMFKIPENIKNSAAYIGVFQAAADSAICSFKVHLSYCTFGGVCDRNFRMWNKITALDLNVKAGFVRGDNGLVVSYPHFIFTDLFLLKKGTTIVVGNAYNGIGCIYTHNQQSISVGDSVSVLVSSGVGDNYKELSYTAGNDIMIGVCFSIGNKFKVFSSEDTTLLLENCLTEENANW